MLLAEKPHPVEHLARARPGGLEAFLQVGVLHLELLHPLRSDPRGPRRGIYRLYTGLGLERTTPEPGELVAEMPHELLKLGERFFLRPFVV